MNKLKYHLVYLVTFLFLTNLTAQNANLRETAIFEKNVQLYTNKNYEQAEQNFALVITKLPNSPLITSNYMMLIKSQYKLGDYAASLEHGKKFLKIFPESSYQDDILFIMGNSYYQLDRFQTAAKTWVKASNVSDDPRLEKKLKLLLMDIVNYNLNVQDIEQLILDVAPSGDGQMLVNIAWANKEFNMGRNIPARNRLTESISKFSESRHTQEARDLLATNGHQFSPEERFALMLPITGENKDIGNAILEGAQLALEEYNKQNNLNLKVAVNNYGQEISEALTVFKMISQNKNILAVMGPVENDMAAACASLSSYEEMPLISPTATESGLTNFSDYFFQLNTQIDTKAEIIARYALDSLKLKRFVTFAPIDDHFVKMVEKFTEVIEEGGAEIVAQEWYYPGDQDVYKQFMKIKRIGLKFAFTDSLIQKNPEIEPQMLDSLYAEYITLEQERIEEEKIKVDSADIPVTTIDGMFIPIFKEDLPFIAPQIAYSNIQAQYLGNSDWYDADLLNKNKNYINGIVFGSDGYLNEESWDFRQFRNEYRTKHKKSPTIFTLIGYDSFKYMLQAYDPTKSMDRNQYLRNLKKLGKYNGVYRTIDINRNRFNQSLRLLKYNYGQIIPLN